MSCETTPSDAPMSLRPRRSLKPPSWMTADLTDDPVPEKSPRTTRKRQPPKPAPVKPLRVEDLVDNRWDDMPPLKASRTKREDSSSTLSEGLIARVETPPDSVSDDEDQAPVKVTREMFQQAAEVALKIHNERLAKQQRKNKLATRKKAVVAAAASSAASSAKENADSNATPPSSASTTATVVHGNRLFIPRPKTDPGARRSLPTVIKVATNNAVYCSPNRYRVAIESHRQNLRVLPPSRSPRQVLPLPGTMAAPSRVILIKGSSGFGIMNGTQRREGEDMAESSGATALVQISDNRRSSQLDELLSKDRLNKSDGSNEVNLTKVKTEIPEETPDIEITSSSISAAGGEKRRNECASSHTGDDNGAEAAGASTVADSVAKPAAKTRARKGARSNIGHAHASKPNQVTDNNSESEYLKRCCEVKAGLASGKLKLMSLAASLGVDAFFFSKIIDEEGVSFGYIQCKFCEDVFPSSIANLHSEHIQTCHADLYRNFLEDSAKGCETKVPQEPAAPSPAAIPSSSSRAGSAARSTMSPEEDEFTNSNNGVVEARELDSERCVPLGVYNLTDPWELKKIPPVSNLDGFISFLQSRPSLVSLLIDYGLMRNNMWCTNCKVGMRTFPDNESQERAVWKCEKGHRLSLRTFSFFNGTSTRFRSSLEFPMMRKMPLRKLLAFLYMWARECTEEQIAMELSMSVFAAEQLSARCRNICLEYCNSFSPKIGGENVVVEVDELRISVSSYICAVDYQSAVAIFVRLRPHETPRSVLAAHVEKGSRIYVRERTNLLSLLSFSDTDFHFNAVAGHVDCIGFVRRPVNACNFDARLIESIGNFWVNVREIYKLCEANPVQCAPYISEMVLRQNAFALDEPVFNHFARILRAAQFAN